MTGEDRPLLEAYEECRTDVDLLHEQLREERAANDGHLRAWTDLKSVLDQWVPCDPQDPDGCCGSELLARLKGLVNW